MKVTILTSKFPKISETFVLHHVTGLLDRQIDVRVIAKDGENKAFSNADIAGYDLRVRTHRFGKGKNTSNGLRGCRG